jgi:hypothetical protein
MPRRPSRWTATNHRALANGARRNSNGNCRVGISASLSRNLHLAARRINALFQQMPLLRGGQTMNY